MTAFIDEPSRESGATRSTKPTARSQVRETTRARILSAMAKAVTEDGPELATVAQVVSLAGVSRKTFYELFDDRSDCLIAAIERAILLAGEAAREPYEQDGRWVDRLRAGLLAVLEFFDEQPSLACLCVLHSMAPDPAAGAFRLRTLSKLTEILDEGRASSRRQPSPITAEAMVGGALAIVGSRLRQTSPQPLNELINPLMSFLTLPYLGARAAEMELSRPMPAPAKPRQHVVMPDPLQGMGIRLTYRTMSVLSAIAAQPGLSNRDVSVRAGVIDQGQISRLLGRLSQLDLIVSKGLGQASGAANAWELTPRGQRIERAVRRASHGATIAEHPMGGSSDQGTG
jgi:AcrR family transcriptional regulator/DNA-binding MarR family transcriptional regulator